MQKKANEKSSRLHAIEFLRVFFVFFVILGHCMQISSELNYYVLKFFHTEKMQTWFCVEFFFIIGGFFLYRKIISAQTIWDLIKNIYLRLFPGLLFIFLLCVVIQPFSIYKLPLILSLTTGLTIPGDATGWGDWYVGVYFWCSLLFIALFYNNIKQGFLWTAILSYFALCLKFNAPYEGFMKTYYTIVGNLLIRGIYSMGLGMAAAFLAEKISFVDRKGVRFFFTVVEGLGLFLIFNYIVRASHNHLNFWGMEIVFAVLLICIANSLGYFSTILNNMSKIQSVSRYSYSVFLGHIPIISYLQTHGGYADTSCALILCVCYFNGNFRISYCGA